MTSMTQPFPRIGTAMRKMMGGENGERWFSAKMSDEAVCVLIFTSNCYLSFVARPLRKSSDY